MFAVNWIFSGYKLDTRLVKENWWNQPMTIRTFTLTFIVMILYYMFSISILFGEIFFSFLCFHNLKIGDKIPTSKSDIVMIGWWYAILIYNAWARGTVHSYFYFVLQLFVVKIKLGTCDAFKSWKNYLSTIIALRIPLPLLDVS